MNFYRFIVLLFITTSVRAYGMCPLTHPSQISNNANALVWRTCPVGQTLKHKTCQGEIQKFNWLEAMRYIAPEAKNISWRLPTSKELAHVFAQCTAQERAHLKNLTTFWSRDRADKDVLQALMVTKEGSTLSEYKTIKAPIFMVNSRAGTSLAPILWSDDEWMEPRDRLDRALAADSKTALKQGSIFETKSQWIYALRLYEELQKRKGAQKLTPSQLQSLGPKILDLQTLIALIP